MTGSHAASGLPIEPTTPSGETAIDLGLFRHGVLVGLALATFILTSLIFAPLAVWPLALVCLVPWILLVAGATHAPRVYLYSYLLGAAFFLLNVRWLYHATGLGYAALALYLAVYFPLCACPIRHAVRRRRLPLGLVVPIVWVGGEMLRAVVISGFPWFFLSHSLYQVRTAIQISDLVGAYGVSFVAAAVNGAIADWVLARWTGPHQAHGQRYRLCSRISTCVAAILVAMTIVYGRVQLSRDTMREGPRVAVLQGDYLSLVTGDETDDERKMRTYFELIEAAAKEKPDIFVLPETPWIMYLNPDARGFFKLSRESFARLRDYAKRYGAYLVTGSASLDLSPNDVVDRQKRYNSAMIFSPDGSEPRRYDKVHVVPFGETVPFRYGRLRFLYFRLNSLMPFSGPDGTFEYSLFPGEEFKVFGLDVDRNGRRTFRVGIPICYEDVMPYVSRKFVSGGSAAKSADILLNISNDGWFGRGTQQPQHLAICVFRAVENRVGIARAVNTGISGFVKPDGKLYNLVSGDPTGRWPGRIGYAVAPVYVDARYSLYSRWGDWFAWGCVVIGALLYLDYWVHRAVSRARHDRGEAQNQD